MAIQMTREQYEKIYGSKPVFSSTSILDDEKPAPIQMTRQEYEETYYPQKKSGTLFDTQAAKEVFTKAGSDVALAQQNQKEKGTLGSTLKTGLTMALQGGLSVPRAIGAGIFGGDKVKEVTGNVIDKMTKFGEAITPDKVQEYVGDKAMQTIEGYNAMTPQERLNQRNKLAVAEVLSYFVGGEGARTVAKSTKPVIQAGEDVLETVTKKADERGVNNVIKELEAIESKYAKTRNANTFSKDIDASSRRIAESNVLDGAVDTDGIIRTKVEGGAIDAYKKQTIEGFEDTVRKALKESKETIPFTDVRKALVREVGKSGLEGADLVSALKGIEKELAGLEVRTKGSSIIDLSYLHDAKLATTRNINYMTPPEKATYRKAVARAYKTLVEDNSNKVDVKAINEKLATYYEDIARLERLDGARAEGGRLGKYTASLAGTLIGGAAGSVGGGVGAAVGGVVGGEAAQVLKGLGMARTFKGGGKGLAKDPTLVRAKLSIPDKVIRANSKIPKTKEITELESKIAKNVADQKKAIAKGDFTLVQALKEVYQSLVEELKKVVAYLNENGSVGLATKDVTKNLHPADVQLLKDFIDSVRIGKEISNKTEVELTHLLKKLGVSENGNANLIANKLEKIVIQNEKGTESSKPSTGGFNGKTLVDPLLTEARKYKTASAFIDTIDSELKLKAFGGEKLSAHGEIAQRLKFGSNLEQEYFKKLTDIWNKANRKGGATGK